LRDPLLPPNHSRSCEPSESPSRSFYGQPAALLQNQPDIPGIRAALVWLSQTVAEISASAKGTTMLWTIAVILLVLWLLGMVSSYTLGGFIHILLVLAIIAVLVRLIQGRNPI
jgi:hypothetical protein